MQNSEWKKCPGCLCKGKCPPRGLEGCSIMGCAGRSFVGEGSTLPANESNKENKNGP